MKKLIAIALLTISGIAAEKGENGLSLSHSDVDEYHEDDENTGWQRDDDYSTTIHQLENEPSSETNSHLDEQKEDEEHGNAIPVTYTKMSEGETKTDHLNLPEKLGYDSSQGQIELREVQI